MSEPNRQSARELAHEYIAKGEPVGWFEPLYVRAKSGTAQIPWADMRTNPNFTEWAQREHLNGSGQRALKVGCGLGDDAEELARLGFEVSAFDISRAAIAWCRERFPKSDVCYTVADLLEPPREWQSTFDFVLESYTLQVLPPVLRQLAIANIAAVIRPGGNLLVICRAREAGSDAGQMPWPLTRDDLTFSRMGLTEIRFEDYVDGELPAVRRFRVHYRKPG